MPTTRPSLLWPFQPMLFGQSLNQIVVFYFLCICLNVVPTKAPRRFTVNATTSTSVVASWELPPVGSRNGIIKGFHLDFKRKDSDSSSIVLVTVDKLSFNSVTKSQQQLHYKNGRPQSLYCTCSSPRSPGARLVKSLSNVTHPPSLVEEGHYQCPSLQGSLPSRQELGGSCLKVSVAGLTHGQ